MLKIIGKKIVEFGDEQYFSGFFINFDLDHDSDPKFFRIYLTQNIWINPVPPASGCGLNLPSHFT